MNRSFAWLRAIGLFPVVMGTGTGPGGVALGAPGPTNVVLALTAAAAGVLVVVGSAGIYLIIAFRRRRGPLWAVAPTARPVRSPVAPPVARLEEFPPSCVRASPRPSASSVVRPGEPAPISSGRRCVRGAGRAAGQKVDTALEVDGRGGVERDRAGR